MIPSAPGIDYLVKGLHYLQMSSFMQKVQPFVQAYGLINIWFVVLLDEQF